MVRRGRLQVILAASFVCALVALYSLVAGVLAFGGSILAVVAILIFRPRSPEQARRMQACQDYIDRKPTTGNISFMRPTTLSRR
jgi:hypothetical protein